MHPRIWLVFFVGIGICHSVVIFSDTVSQYRSCEVPFCTQDGRTDLAVRLFDQDQISYAIAVNTQTCQAYRIPWHLCQKKAPIKRFRDTFFCKILSKSTTPPYPITNDGITQFSNKKGGLCLSMDLCPSPKPLDKRIITELPILAYPFPLAIALSGKWLDTHPQDLAWLLDQQRQYHIQITWINHSYSHPFDPKKSIESTFFLTSDFDVKQDILEQEKTMLAHGLMPSVYVRFPGLVSCQSIIKITQDLHLIPIGSLAWLAKGEMPTTGSIILVHGNGNEPKGIDILQLFLKTHPHLQWESLVSACKKYLDP